MYINCIVFLVLCVFDSRSFIIDDKRTLESITSRIISQFTKHNIIFHYENETRYRVDSIISLAKVKGCYLMANYDLHSEQTNIISRPEGYKFFHVVLLRNYSWFQNFTMTDILSLISQDILLFIINLDKDTPSCSLTENDIEEWNINQNLEKARSMFMVDAQSLILYSICFFCGNVTNSPQEICDLSTTDDIDCISFMLNIVRDVFTDFNEHILNVGYIKYKPYFYLKIVEENKNSVLMDLSGSEGELLVLFHEKLNVWFHMIEFHDKENAWHSAIEAVANNSLHWAVGGITLTIKRANIVDFTSTINMEMYTVLYSIHDDPWLAWKNIVLPFEMTVWLVLITAIVLISGLFYITTKHTGTQDIISFLYFIQGCLRLLVEQPVPSIRESMKTRWTSFWLMILWLLVAVIMTNAYRSKLTSSLINTRAVEPDSIDQLVEMDYKFQVSNEDSSVITENLASSADPKFLETLKRSKNNLDFCPSILATIPRKIAVIDEETYIHYTVQEECRKLMDLEEHDSLRLIKDELFPSGQGWPMQMNSPFRSTLNGVISRLNAAGIFEKWNGDYASTAQMVPKSHQGRLCASCRPRFTLASIASPVIIWALGMLAATLVFIGELIRGR